MTDVAPPTNTELSGTSYRRPSMSRFPSERNDPKDWQLPSTPKAIIIHALKGGASTLTILGWPAPPRACTCYVSSWSLYSSFQLNRGFRIGLRCPSRRQPVSRYPKSHPREVSRLFYILKFVDSLPKTETALMFPTLSSQISIITGLRDGIQGH